MGEILLTTFERKDDINVERLNALVQEISGLLNATVSERQVQSIVSTDAYAASTGGTIASGGLKDNAGSAVYIDSGGFVRILDDGKINADKTGVSVLTLSIDESAIDHDALLNFVANEHLPGIDEDDMASDSAAHVPTQQSTKAYVDAKTVSIPICLQMFDATPSRASVSDWNGGLLSLATAQALGPATPANDITVTKGIGKLIIVVNAGTDVDGTITVTGTSVDRNTGATTPADTDTITVDALTTDNTVNDSNGNPKYDFEGAYITSKWFTGTVVLSTSTLNLSDVDVYHCSFEQMNDKPNLTVETFDVNLYTTNVAAEFDVYLHTLEVTGDKCDINNETELHVGADGETAIANKYWRLRRGNINKILDGTTDGLWVNVYYSNSPVYVEDVTLKVWLAQETTLT